MAYLLASNKDIYLCTLKNKYVFVKILKIVKPIKPVIFETMDEALAMISWFEPGVYVTWPNKACNQKYYRIPYQATARKSLEPGAKNIKAKYKIYALDTVTSRGFFDEYILHI